MSFSEYLVTFYAIIIGLIVTNYFSGWADMIKHRSTSNFYWAHILLTIVLLLAMIREFWVEYDQFKSISLTFPDFLQVLVNPVIYYFSSILLFPDRGDKQASIEYKEFFFSKIYDLTFLFSLTFVIDIIRISITRGLHVMIAVNFIGFACCMLIIRYKRQRIIESVVIISTIMVTYLLIGLLN